MSPEGRERIARSGPLLVGTLAACSFAAAGLTNAVNEPRFELFLHLMVFVAVGTSALAIVYGRSATSLGVIVIAAAVAAVAQRGATIPPLALMVPSEALGDDDLMWATLWAWLMIGLCFTLATPRNVLFCLVAGLAMFGLTATVNLNTIMMVYFALMVFAAVFVWGYEHIAEGEEARTTLGARPRDWWRLARTQALAGSLLVAGVVVAGLIVGTALYTVGPRFYLRSGDVYRYTRWIQISLLSYGGMLNTFYVGRGSVTLSGAPALEVKAESGHLWRGQAYDQYTGRGWTKRDTHTYAIVRDGDWWRIPQADDVPGRRLRQRVRLAGVDSRAMFSAARPIAVKIPRQTVEGQTLRFSAQVDAYGCLMTTFRMPPGTEYEVISALPPSDPETLRAAGADYPAEIVATCIDQITPAAMAKLQPLVDELTADAATPYDKVTALRDYIERECVYNDRTPPIPAGEDAAVYFLTHSRAGACDLFATALAVMCRIAGVPARVATGFITGIYRPEREAFVPLQRDAHA
ncbi:MAG: transglutaminase domain-containing protein, partial [Armatimonadetes bacterium]|nr:transglutaminase domain-containing protein [Armatimonadota bacterium]